MSINTLTPFSTRTASLEARDLIDVTEEARRLGFMHPVAATREAWEDCIRWDDEIEATKMGFTGQEEQARLRDVLWMALLAAKRSRASRTYFTLDRVPPDGCVARARPVTLVLSIGPGDNWEPVITIGMP